MEFRAWKTQVDSSSHKVSIISFTVNDVLISALLVDVPFVKWATHE